MLCTVLKSKLHMANVTETAPEYEGSLSLDRTLMDAVRLLPYEKVLVSNMNNTNRFETYAIPAPAGSGQVRLNGAAAHLGAVGDRIIVFAFCQLPYEQAARHHPLVLALDARNKPAGPLKGA